MPHLRIREYVQKLIRDLSGTGDRQADRALEIVKEEFDKVLADMRANSILTQPFDDLEVVVTKRKEGRDFVYTVGIDNPVYNILDEGVSQVPRHAADYGLKAFPIHAPRKPGYEPGNRSMTTPGSLGFQTAFSGVPEDDNGEQIIFRPTIYSPIAARHFTQQVEARALQRCKDEGLQIDLKIVKQGNSVGS